MQKAQERRQFGRRDTRLEGWIEPVGRPRICCFVTNLSEVGALLELMDDLFLPYRFHLVVPARGIRSDCEIRHTSHRSVGVRFCVGGAIDLGSGQKLTEADYWKR